MDPREGTMSGTPINWKPIIRQALNVVRGYPYLITLRQLHYRLVMTQGLGYLNTNNHYKRLSELTARGRREGVFDALQDQTREIYERISWDSPSDGINWLTARYERDRTEGQDHTIYLAGEKATLLAQLRSWFATNTVDQNGSRLYGEDDQASLGFPIILTRGYGSQTYLDNVKEHVLNDGRKAVLIYAGDFDPSGEDILRDFLARCPVWEDVRHIAVRPEQVVDLNLPVTPGKDTDSRAAAFIERHGELMQVEVEAIPPDTLRDLYTDALEEFWDAATFRASLEQEQADRARLREIAFEVEDEDDDGE
jgi:hypothetical protein